MMSLLVFFVTSSKATKFRSKLKEKIENEFKEGGQRNCIQVLCNGGVAGFFAILYIIERGIGNEIPINFNTDYNASWFAMALLASFACANGDTWASELAPVLAQTDPVLITTFKRVPKGTNGGITLVGFIVSTSHPPPPIQENDCPSN